ncbi:34143_t:CDS:2, partial [Gigaspora margarita]
SNIKALQNLSGTSIAHIEPNRNQANIEPNSESLKCIENFQLTQILLHCKRPSPTFPTSSIPKSVWTIPNPELLTNKKISKELSSVNNDELAKMSNTTRDHYSPEDMHADLEDLARNSEISFEEVLT